MRSFGALALLASSALANVDKHLMSADGRIVEYEPEVGLGIDDDLCIFKNDWDEWCFKTITPMARVGVEWDQVYDMYDRST